MDQENKTEGRPLNEKTGRDPSLVRTPFCLLPYVIQYSRHTLTIKFPHQVGDAPSTRCIILPVRWYSIYSVCVCVSLSLTVWYHSTTKRLKCDALTSTADCRLPECLIASVCAYPPISIDFFFFSIQTAESHFVEKRTLTSMSFVWSIDKISTRKKKWNF